MTRRRILYLAVLTALTFAVQAASSPAAQALQQMRAARCCVENCGHLPSLKSPMHCGCCLTSAAPDPTSATSAKPQLPAPDIAPIAMVSASMLSSAERAIVATAAASPRAAPVFLLTLNIRL